MAGIVFRSKSNELKSLTGSEYTDATPKNKTLFVQTGTATSDRLRYGLTTDTTASIYSPVIMLDGKKHYIGRTSTTSTTTTKQRIETNTYNVPLKSSLTTTSSMRRTVDRFSSKNSSTAQQVFLTYVFDVTSKFRNGTDIGRTYRQLTLTHTRYYYTDSGVQQLVEFSTNQATTATLTAANGLEYRFLKSGAMYDESRRVDYETYWELYPANNTNYKYDGYFSTSSYITGLTVRKSFNITQSDHYFYNPWIIIPRIRTYYTKILVDQTLASIIDNSLYGGHNTHKSSTSYSVVNNTYTTSSAGVTASATTAFSYTWKNQAIDYIDSDSSFSGYVNGMPMHTQTYAIQSSLSKFFTFSGLGSTTLSDYTWSSSTDTLDKNYTWKNTYASANSYLTGTTTYTLSPSEVGGIFTKHSASKSARNHVKYSQRTQAGSTTRSKGTPYIPVSGFSMYEVTQNVSVTSESSEAIYLINAYHTAKVTTSVRDYTETRTTTYTYTDTVSTNTYTNNCNA